MTVYILLTMYIIHVLFLFFVLLLQDSTVNVRYRLCSLLPDLKSILLLPPDREYQQEFESAIAILLMERDPECLVTVRHSVKRMDKINYRIQSVSTYTCTYTYMYMYTVYIYMYMYMYIHVYMYMYMYIYMYTMYIYMYMYMDI